MHDSITVVHCHSLHSACVFDFDEHLAQWASETVGEPPTILRPKRRRISTANGSGTGGHNQAIIQPQFGRTKSLI